MSAVEAYMQVTYFYLTTVNGQQRGHEFEREQGGNIWEGLKGRKERGK